MIIDDDDVPDTLTMFVEFVRYNPHLHADDPTMTRVWRAYAAETARCRA